MEMTIHQSRKRRYTLLESFTVNRWTTTTMISSKVYLHPTKEVWLKPAFQADCQCPSTFPTSSFKSLVFASE